MAKLTVTKTTFERKHSVLCHALFERVFKDKAFEFTGEQTRKDVRQDVSKMFSV